MTIEELKAKRERFMLRSKIGYADFMRKILEEEE